MRKIEMAGLLGALVLAVVLSSCSQTDAVNTAGAIHRYLPTVTGLAQDVATVVAGLDPAEAAEVQRVSTQVQAELTELEQVSGAYVAAPSSDGWIRLGAVVDQLVSDTDQGLMQALAIKNAASQAKAKMALSALDAAVHVLDGYLLAARTPAQTQSVAAQRTVKLEMVAREWSAGDWQRVELALGVERGQALRAAESAGL